MRVSGNYGFRTDPAPPFALRVLSLGAGVQSSRLLLGILEGEFGTPGVDAPGVDAPSCAVFADTGWEPKPVYEWLTYLKSRCDAAGFPLHIVSAGNILDDAYATRRPRGGKGEGRFAAMPLYTHNQDGEGMMMRRQCTNDYKIRPISKFVRKLAGLKPGALSGGVYVKTWQGISVDEMSRVNESKAKWEWRRFPLVERRESRAGCLRWLRLRGLVAPKSACIGCPYRRDSEWLWMQKHDPDGLASAVAFDEALRDGERFIYGWDRPAYLHKSHRPLRQVVADLEILDAQQIDAFGPVDECSGTCFT